MISILLFQSLWVFAMSGFSFCHWAVYICPFARLLDYFFGILLGRFFLRNCIIEKRIGLIFAFSFLLSISMIGLSVVVSQENPWFYSVAWILVSALLVATFYNSEFRDNAFSKFVLKNKMFVFLGNISMELFLIHQLVLRYKDVFVKSENFWIKGMSVIVSFAICVLCAAIWRFIVGKYYVIIKGEI